MTLLTVSYDESWVSVSVFLKSVSGPVFSNIAISDHYYDMY